MTPAAEHGSLEEHERLVKECLAELALMGYAAWENPRRAVKIGNRWVSLTKAGRGDIHVILSAHVDGNLGSRLVGIHGEVECKTGQSSQSSKQRIHMRVVRNSGGVYIIARSKQAMRAELVSLGFSARCQADYPAR